MGINGVLVHLLSLPDPPSRHGAMGEWEVWVWVCLSVFGDFEIEARGCLRA